jgi:hypothetical protein
MAIPIDPILFIGPSLGAGLLRAHVQPARQFAAKITRTRAAAKEQ